MYLSLYLSIYVCMHVCVYACMHVCMYVCMHASCIYDDRLFGGAHETAMGGWEMAAGASRAQESQVRRKLPGGLGKGRACGWSMLLVTRLPEQKLSWKKHFSPQKLDTPMISLDIYYALLVLYVRMKCIPCWGNVVKKFQDIVKSFLFFFVSVPLQIEQFAKVRTISISFQYNSK